MKLTLLIELVLFGGYPAKPIRYIVPVAAGGGSDMVGRTVTERWGNSLKQTFIVDNQGGELIVACWAIGGAGNLRDLTALARP